MKRPAPIHFLTLIWLLFTINISVAQPLDTQAIKAIDLQIAPQPLADLGLSDPKILQARVIGNLTQWRFPIYVHAEKELTYTHTLAVEIGEVKNAATPVGFSFAAGNSDPRAQDFQKANVMPIQCRLTANAKPEQQAELTMTFSAPSPPIDSRKLQDSLVENISTVCFDLLDGLQFLPTPVANPNAPVQATETISKPTWMPSVQIETIPAPRPKPGSTEATKPDEEPKQLIIHNQGTPLIFKFGHERR